MALDAWRHEAAEEVTVPAVDATGWQPSEGSELLHVHAWSVPYIDSLAQHTLNELKPTETNDGAEQSWL